MYAFSGQGPDTGLSYTHHLNLSSTNGRVIVFVMMPMEKFLHAKCVREFIEHRKTMTITTRCFMRYQYIRLLTKQMCIVFPPDTGPVPLGQFHSITSYAQYGNCLTERMQLLPNAELLVVLQSDFEKMVDAGMLYEKHFHLGSSLLNWKYLRTRLTQYEEPNEELGHKEGLASNYANLGKLFSARNDGAD